jgi:hypothetical protein
MIKLIPNDQAKVYISQNHYTQSCALGRISYGYFEGTDLKGAIVFSQPAGKFTASGLWEGGNQKNTLEFIRMFLDDTSDFKESQFISQVIKELRKDMPEVKMLVTYADSQAGHVGYIYQASNWLYVGTASDERKIFIDGVRVHRRMLNSKYGTSSLPRLHDILAEQGKVLTYSADRYVKYKYIYLLPKGKEREALLKQLKVQVLPYPKGDISRYDKDHNNFTSTSDTHPHHTHATPTPTSAPKTRKYDYTPKAPKEEPKPPTPSLFDEIFGK